MIKSLQAALTISMAGLIISCAPQTKESATVEEEKRSEWISLFDGTSTDGWRGFNMETLPANWVIEEGTLKSLGTGADVGGDIIYGEMEFENFELEVDWKISEGGNSGIFYHVVEGEQYHGPYQNAPEYQLIDNIGFEYPLEAWQSVGANYAMHIADSTKNFVKPANEWNKTKILFTPEKVEHWLNGEKLLEFVPWSEDWNERRLAGKWKDHPDYGKAKTGFIGFQDHGSFIWFRNVRIRRL